MHTTLHRNTGNTGNNGNNGNNGHAAAPALARTHKLLWNMFFATRALVQKLGNSLGQPIRNAGIKLDN